MTSPAKVTTQTYVDIPGIIRDNLEIGYDSSAKGYDGASCGVSVSIGSQSPDIAQGVNDAFEYREGEGTDELAQTAGRGGPGADVRLRVPRDPRADAAADPTPARSPPASCPRCAARGPCRTCGRMARPR